MGVVQAKICGLSTGPSVQAAVDAGADLIGFVFYAASPRDIAPAQAAALAIAARERGVRVAAVTVDADDVRLDAIVAALRPDLIQLHGRETPARAAAVKARTSAGVIKAIRVSKPRTFRPPPRSRAPWTT